MARKSKGKFKMQSPLRQTPEVSRTELKHGNLFGKDELGAYDEDYLSRTKLKGETNSQYLIRQLARIKKAKKDKEENRSKEFDEQRDSYDGGPVEGSQMDKDLKAKKETKLQDVPEIPEEEFSEVPPPPPPPPSETYEVVKDDSLSKIAAANNTTVQALMDANPHIKHKDKIYPGNKITIPGSTSEFKDTDGEFSVYTSEEDRKIWEGDD